MVADRQIDRAKWASLVSEMIGLKARGKKAPFARLVGVDTRTLDHWLKCEVAVSEESVRRVARGVGRNAMDLLVEVGYYEAAEVGQPAPLIDPEDPEVKMILAAQVPEHVKREMIDKLAEMRARDQERRLADLRWLIDQRTR